MIFYGSDTQAQLTLHVGPIAGGAGGSNPISIPPVNIAEYELVYLTEDKTEWSLSIVPGVLYGYRSFLTKNAYVSLGGGIVLNFNGVGPGVYSALGYEFCFGPCFNVEYKQAVGHTGRQLISAYAVRVGVSFDY